MSSIRGSSYAALRSRRAGIEPERPLEVSVKQSHNVTVATFYWSKQVRDPLRFKFKGWRNRLLMGDMAKSH